MMIILSILCSKAASTKTLHWSILVCYPNLKNKSLKFEENIFVCCCWTLILVS
jgi:hypothetical protein